MHRDENSSTGIEENDWEIQPRKQIDPCAAVETKDVAETRQATVLCWMFQC